ncbi:MAG: GGDEF domain-containing protein [Bacteroidota bacterium]
MNIQFQFDVRTIALFVAMTFFVQAASIGAQAYMIRELKQYRGVGTAMLANLCAAAALILRLFAARLPEYPAIILSNVLVLLGPGLFYVALGQFTGFTYSRAFVAGVIAVVAALLLYFTYWDDDLAARVIVLSLGSIAMVAILIYQLWRTQKTALKLSANLMLLAFITYEAFLVIRTVSIILDPPRNTTSLNPVQSATYLLVFAISIFWSTGFVLMVSQRLRNDLVDMATIDSLTGISNRRATEAFLERELARVQRNLGEFSVFLIDIDNFKLVNDRWGHITGDEVLVKIAGIFQSMIRRQDWVGRWGGEEFLMIVPGPTDVQVLAERVRIEVASATFAHAGESFGITVSIGVASVSHAEPIDQVLHDADMALYQAKQTRNTVSLAA